MMVSTSNILSVTEANKNFSKVTKKAHEHGDTIIFKRNKPAYIVIDIEKMGAKFLAEYEVIKLKLLADALLVEYKDAYDELAKW